MHASYMLQRHGTLQNGLRISCESSMLAREPKRSNIHQTSEGIHQNEGPSICFHNQTHPQNRQNIPSYPHWSGISAVSVGKWCVQVAVVFATKAHGLWGLGSFFLSGKPMERRDDLINKAEMMHKSYDRTYDKIWIWIYNSKMTKNGWCDAYWCTEFMLLDDNYNPSIVFLSVVVLHYVFDIVLNVEA